MYQTKRNLLLIIVTSVLALVVGFAVGYQIQSVPSVASLPTITDDAHEAQIAELKQRVQQLEASLQQATQVIAELNQNKLKTAQTQTTAKPSVRLSMLNDKLANVPEFLLKGQLGMFFDDKSLDEIADIHQFAQRALEVALDNEAPAPESLSATIEFSLSPVYGSRAIGLNAELAQYDPVFAHIISEQKRGALIVKWQNMSNGEVLLFRSVRLQEGGEGQYVSLKPNKGWQPGIYRVTLHTMSDDITPVASNSYSIATVLEQASGPKGPNQKVIDDLMLSGQAVKKQ